MQLQEARYFKGSGSEIMRRACEYVSLCYSNFNRTICSNWAVFDRKHVRAWWWFFMDVVW